MDRAGKFFVFKSVRDDGLRKRKLVTDWKYWNEGFKIIQYN